MLADNFCLGVVYGTAKAAIYINMDCNEDGFSQIWTYFINVLARMHLNLRLCRCSINVNCVLFGGKA